MSSKCHRHYTNAVADMWSSIFYFQKTYCTKFPNLKLLKMKQHALREAGGDGVQCFAEGRQKDGGRELRRAWKVKV